MIAFVLAAALAAPNVVLLSVDTLRADHLSCYGYPQETSPHIDAFAEQGLLFEDCICEVPLTNPSFGSMMTSRYPRMTGVVRNGLPMPAEIPTVAEGFKAAGYETFCVQSNWTLKAKLSGLNRGFDVYDDSFDTRRWGIIKSERYGDEVTEIALGLLKKRDPSKPFFAWIHYSDPHAPYRFHSDLDPSGKAYPDRANKVHQVRRDYDSEIAFADREIGRLLKALPRENTFVLFVGDHGESLYEHEYLGHGRRIYQTCAHVPLIVRGPGIEPGRTDAPVRTLDVGPTLMAMAGLKPHAGMLGRNVLGAEAPPPARFVETYGGAVPKLPGAKALMADRPPMREGVLEDGWKLILHSGTVELYNLRVDPMETKDLAAQEPERVAALRKRLDEFRGVVVQRQTEGAALSEQDLDALESLGYIE